VYNNYSTHFIFIGNSSSWNWRPNASYRTNRRSTSWSNSGRRRKTCRDNRYHDRRTDRNGRNSGRDDGNYNRRTDRRSPDRTNTR